MGLFNLKDVKNHPRRSAFDLSSKVAFTAKVGELLPVYWQFTMPGDKFKLRHQHFTRTQPVNTAAYTRIREYYDWFYVPFHELWRNFPESISQMQKNAQHSQSPTSAVDIGSRMPHSSVTLYTILTNLDNRTNYFGFNRADLSMKLMQYLRTGNIVNGAVATRNFGTSVSYSDDSYSQNRAFSLNLNLFPFLAYKKFCQDYFRLTQWQDSAPYLWNVDYLSKDGIISFPSSSDEYWNGNTMFDLEYANWNKDMYMGILPDTQYGDVATIDLNGFASAEGDINLPLYSAQSQSSTSLQQMLVGEKISNEPNFGVYTRTGGDPGIGNPLFVKGSVEFDVSNSLSLNVLALRRGEALQRWKEISLNNSQNYRSQVKAHFGVDVGSHMSHMSTYVGGSATNLDISEVINTNLEQSESEASIAGKGVGSASSFESFEAKDWGIIMCLYHAVPLLDYVSTAPHPQFTLIENTDFPIPELDSIGMESIPVSQFSNSSKEIPIIGGSDVSATFTMGYLPRYWRWKTNIDVVLGSFSTTEKEWVAPITPSLWRNMLGTLGSSPATLTYQFFKINPSIMNSIFQDSADSTWDSDPLLINCLFDVRVTRNLDYSGMPY